MVHEVFNILYKTDLLFLLVLLVYVLIILFRIFNLFPNKRKATNMFSQIIKNIFKIQT